MLYYRHPLFSIYGQDRSGTHSMEHYLNTKISPKYDIQPAPRIETVDFDILLIRHPYERWNSCERVFRQAHKMRDQAGILGMWQISGFPYMHNIKCENYRIIPTENMNSYVEGHESGSGERMHYNRWGKPVKHNRDRTKPEQFPHDWYSFDMNLLDKELELYNEILNTKEQISLEEWQSLVSECERKELERLESGGTAN